MAPVTTTLANASGSIAFQPKDMSWSKRSRGSDARIGAEEDDLLRFPLIRDLEVGNLQIVDSGAARIHGRDAQAHQSRRSLREEHGRGQRCTANQFSWHEFLL